MTKLAHLLAAVNACLGFAILVGWISLTVDELAALMGALGLVGAAVGSFFDPKIPWWGPTE